MHNEPVRGAGLAWGIDGAGNPIIPSEAPEGDPHAAPSEAPESTPPSVIPSEALGSASPHVILSEALGGVPPHVILSEALEEREVEGSPPPTPFGAFRSGDEWFTPSGQLTGLGVRPAGFEPVVAVPRGLLLKVP